MDQLISPQETAAEAPRPAPRQPDTPRASLSVSEIRVKGKTVSVPAVTIGGRTVITAGTWLKTASVQDEELTEGETVADPASFVAQLERSGLQADMFTFAQKLPDTAPKYKYHVEWDNLAAIPITTFSDWWDKRVEPSVRRAVRKAAKAGVTVKLVELDDALVQGIVNINNESPVRQGRPFWHYQKSFEAMKMENSTYADRNAFLAAYLQEELIGYIRITYADRCAQILQLLTLMKHFDKRTANALLAKAVEVCAEKGMSYLLYCNYVYNDPESSLTEFKRRNGFEMILVPRYYIPLTPRGTMALSLGLHRGLMQRIPKPVLARLLRMRNRWYERRASAVEGTL